MLIRTQRSLLASLIALPFACAEDVSESVESKWQQIAGGEPDEGSPNVVLLLSWNSSNPVGTLGSCTAEVVAPNVLLTAAHCLASGKQFNGVYLGHDGNDLGKPIDPSKASVKSQLHMAKEVHAHPQYQNTNGYYDVGIVILEDDLDGIEPLPINRVKPTTAMLSDVSIVGYGKTFDRDTSFAVTKHRADGLKATLDSTNTMTVGDAQKHACVGASGGPVFAEIDGVLTILGTDSYSDETGDASRCRIASRYQRVDPYLDFLDQYIPQETTPKDAGMPKDAGRDASTGGKDAGKDAGSVDEEEDAGKGSDAGVSADAGVTPPKKDSGVGMRRDAGEDSDDEDDDDSKEDDDEAQQPQRQKSDGCNVTQTASFSGALEFVLLALWFAWRRRSPLQIADHSERAAATGEP